MSLRLRLNLIITALLLLIMLAGAVLTINSARSNVRAEVASTEKLALYLFEIGVLNNPALSLEQRPGKAFGLKSLQHMRHLKIQFFGSDGKLLDSNQSDKQAKQKNAVPAWFEAIMDSVTPVWEPKSLPVDRDNRHWGELVITPDPTYEYSEVWNQITGVLVLVGIFFVAVNAMVYWAVAKALSPVERILEALNQLEQGNLKARLPQFDLLELARISEKFNRMVETLEHSILQNHRLSQQLISLQEEERKSLARDLHDEFGQCLTAIHADASVLLLLSESEYPKVRASALAITQLSHHLIDMVSDLMQRLRPGVLDELGLEEAIRDLVTTWKLRNPDIACSLILPTLDAASIAEPLAVTVYRIVQECLTNISRHAQASQVEISMAQNQGIVGSSLAIHISDDGRGFDPQRATGFGLAGMRERIEGLGGALRINSEPGHGFALSVKLPLELKANL